MLRSKNTENEEVSSFDWRAAGAAVLNQTGNVRGVRRISPKLRDVGTVEPI
jgi:hypothetical protein